MLIWTLNTKVLTDYLLYLIYNCLQTKSSISWSVTKSPGPMIKRCQYWVVVKTLFIDFLSQWLKKIDRKRFFEMSTVQTRKDYSPEKAFLKLFIILFHTAIITARPTGDTTFWISTGLYYCRTGTYVRNHEE